MIKFKRKDHGFDMGKMIAISPLAIEMKWGNGMLHEKGSHASGLFPSQVRKDVAPGLWKWPIKQTGQQKPFYCYLKLHQKRSIFTFDPSVEKKKLKFAIDGLLGGTFVYRLQKGGRWSVKWILISATSYALSQVGYFMYLHLKDVSWDPENRFKWGGERIEAFHHKQEKESHSYFPEN